MLLTAPAYSAENEKLSRTPILRIEFVRNSVSVGKFSTLAVADDSEWLPYIEVVQGLESHVEPERGRTSNGSIVILISDIGGAITRLISGAGIGGDVVTFSKGFDGIPSADFQVFRTGRVESCRLTPDLGAYEITINDPQALLNRQIHEVWVSPLTIDLVSGETTELFVEDASGYQLPALVRIDFEWIEATGKTATSLTGLTRGVSVGSATSLDVTHAAGSTVQEVLHVGPGHPMDALFETFTDTDKRGLSLDPALVDSTTLAAMKIALGVDLLMEWRIEKPSNAQDWIEKEICLPLGLYMRTTGDGKLSLVNSIEPAAPVADIDTSNTLTEDNGAQVLSWDQNLKSVINVVTTYFDHDETTDQLKSSLEIADADSITKYGRRPLVRESRGFRSSLADTASFITEISNRILDRYSNGAPIITAAAFLKEHLIEPGDVISLTSPDLPNLGSGLRGLVGELAEVISRNIAFESGRTELVLQLADICFQWNLEYTNPDDPTFNIESIAQDSVYAYVGNKTTGAYPTVSITRVSRRSGSIVPIVDGVEIARRWTTGEASVISIAVDSNFVYALVNENDGGSQSQVSLYAITHATFGSDDVVAERLSWHSAVILEDLAGPGFVSAGLMKLADGFLYFVADANDGNASTFFRVDAADFSAPDSFALATFQSKRFAVDVTNGFLYPTGNWGDEAGDEFTIVRATLSPFAYDTRLRVDTDDDQGGYDPANLPITQDPDFLFVAFYGALTSIAKVDKPTFTLDSIQGLVL